MVVVDISLPMICMLLPAVKVCVVDIVVPLILIPDPAIKVSWTFGAVMEFALILITLIFGFKLTTSFKILIFVPAVKLVAIELITLLLMFIPVPAVSNNCRLGAVIEVALILVALILVVVSLVDIFILLAFIVAPLLVVARIVPVVISDELRFVLHILVDVILFAVTS